MVKTFFVKTFGCQMNKSDSEKIAAVLESADFIGVTEDKAQILIINTCSVRQKAEDRVWGILRKYRALQKNGQELTTVVTGCVAGKDPEKLIGKADLVLPIRQIQELPQLILDLLDQGRKIKSDVRLDQQNKSRYLKIKPRSGSKFSALVPVMDGCNNFCTYCAVPHARGREVSRPESEILAEVAALGEKGFKTVTLLGQNVNSYQNPEVSRNEPGADFARLLEKIDLLPGDFWVWFLTSHPKDMSPELIKTVAGSQKIGHYIHLPAQAGSDRILAAMNRKYSRAHYIDLIRSIRQAMPEAVISTDIIVGFPGETGSDFEETVRLFEEVKFDMAYLARYSPREKTAAAKLNDDVSESEKKRRQMVLNNIISRQSLEKNRELEGRVVPVLVEKKVCRGGRDYYLGKTKEYKTVRFAGGPGLVGQIKSIKVTKGLDWGLAGEPAGSTNGELTRSRKKFSRSRG